MLSRTALVCITIIPVRHDDCMTRPDWSRPLIKPWVRLPCVKLQTLLSISVSPCEVGSRIFGLLLVYRSVVAEIVAVDFSILCCLFGWFYLLLFLGPCSCLVPNPLTTKLEAFRPPERQVVDQVHCHVCNTIANGAVLPW